MWKRECGTEQCGSDLESKEQGMELDQGEGEL